MNVKMVIVGAFSFIIGIGSLLFLPAKGENSFKSPSLLPTYYSYSESQTQSLKELTSQYTINEEQLKKWDDLAQDWIKRNDIPYFGYLRFYTYLYAAQRDAAFLSHNSNQYFEGTLDPISLDVFKMFFPNFKAPNNYRTDAYSEKLASIVLPKFYERFQKENSLNFPFETSPEGGYEFAAPQWIASVGNWIPWIIKGPLGYLPPKPYPKDSKEWLKEIQAIKNSQKYINSQKKEAINFWAGLTKDEAGDWRAITNTYLFENNVPIAKILLVRSMLTMALYDTDICCFNSKYKYSVMRPSTRDPSVQTFVQVPPHPSYPSGHSTGSTVAADVLSYYFPEDRSKWQNLASQAGMSRIWAGIHYPIDHKAGQMLGRKISEQITNYANEKESDRQKSDDNTCLARPLSTYSAISGR